jgi:hypothetical protein
MTEKNDQMTTLSLCDADAEKIVGGLSMPLPDCFAQVVWAPVPFPWDPKNPLPPLPPPYECL